MTSVSEQLNKVWSEFRKAGITDDLKVIEYIARILLEESGFIVAPSKDSTIRNPIPKNLEILESEIPRRPSVDLNIDLEAIRQCLRQAVKQAGGAAVLFDRYVLFRLPAMLSGGRYPTPRHIIESMRYLAKVEPHHNLADFACGSGGFLVHRPLPEPRNESLTLGIDISPEWAKLARANAALHGLSSLVRIETGNALQVFALDGEMSEIVFDRILMNSPFGEKIDEKLAEKTLGQKVGSRSETALTLLALQKLAQGGQAALLVPSGLLFSNSKGEQEVRRKLMSEHELEAIISLPKDALQPYSLLQTHLLLVSKPEDNPQISENSTWFWQLERDGYPSGRGRDLTQDPDESASDLPFVTEILTNPTTPFLFPKQNPQISIGRVVKGTSLLGFVCEAISTEVSSVTLYPQPNETTSAFLLVETASIVEQHLCLRVPLDGKEPSLIENRQQLIQELFKLKKQDSDPGTRLLSQPVKAAAILVSPENQAVGTDRVRLLGVAIQRDAIQSPTYDLRPERYVEKQQETRSTDSPAELLAQIYQNQRRLSQHIESLFGRLELPAIANQQLPSPLADIASLGILNKLNPEQKTIWEQIQAKTEKIDSSEEKNQQTAVHFTIEELIPEDTSDMLEATRSTLDLLECMGVIVPVTITAPSTDELIQCYRRVTERDLWQFD
ncbi:MAG: N-6 DNA methylase [Symploca sp. SIO2G7]|nr:N-6 DNA methylase [Symploca sp. SIO2G7]